MKSQHQCIRSIRFSGRTSAKKSLKIDIKKWEAREAATRQNISQCSQTSERQEWTQIDRWSFYGDIRQQLDLKICKSNSAESQPPLTSISNCPRMLITWRNNLIKQISRKWNETSRQMKDRSRPSYENDIISIEQVLTNICEHWFTHPLSQSPWHSRANW